MTCLATATEQSSRDQRDGDKLVQSRDLATAPLTTAAASRAMDDRDHTASFDDHLQLPGLAEQLASQTDAYLHADGGYIPVHSAVLAVQSCVFADMFKVASDSDKTAHRRDGNICIPMTGHTSTDVCTAVKFLYQRTISHWENSPCKDIWKDIDRARPILQFAHKFKMKSVLKDCDLCLSEKAQEDQGTKLFTPTDAVLLWAALAEECKLTRLLSHAEMFMSKTLTPKSWLCDNPVTSQLSSACLFRVLRAAQEYSSASRTAFERHNAAAHLHHTKHFSLHHDQCPKCSQLIGPPAGCTWRPAEPSLKLAEYITVEELRRWQFQDA